MAFAQDCIQLSGKCLNEIQVITVDQCTENDVEFVVRDRDGITINLVQYEDESSSSIDEGVEHGVYLIAKEMPNAQVPYFKVKCEIADAEAGLVRFNYDADTVRYGGIWVAMVLLYEQGAKKQLIPYYLEVQPILDPCTTPVLAPLTIPEVRLALRDRCREDNFLLDNVEFSTSDIAWAIRRPIDYWNEVSPPIDTFTPATFPFRYHWLEGVIGELLTVAVSNYARNHLPYQIGGGSVDDKKKAAEYVQLAKLRLDGYKSWVREKKIEINATRCYGSVGSDYGYRYGNY